MSANSPTDQSRTDTSHTRVRERCELSVGAVVEDTESDSDPAVVVNVPGTTAADWYVEGRGSVAADNPDYPDTDPVVCVVFEPDLETEFPLYRGRDPLPLGDLDAAGIEWYAFPENRLQQVGRRETVTVALDRIDPSPYHARTFRAADNEAFIDQIRHEGLPHAPPVARVAGERVELINGHKRVWAAHLAGRQTVTLRLFGMADVEAAKSFARHHLPEYDAAERATALERLRANFSRAEVAEILPADWEVGA